jgi:transposase-like protein
VTAHRATSVFAGFRFPPEVISLAVRWYLRYGLACRDVEELLAERGVTVDHVSVYRRAASVHPGVHRGCAALTGRVRLEAGATVR